MGKDGKQKRRGNMPTKRCWLVRRLPDTSVNGCVPLCAGELTTAHSAALPYCATVVQFCCAAGFYTASQVAKTIADLGLASLFRKTGALSSDGRVHL